MCERFLIHLVLVDNIIIIFIPFPDLLAFMLPPPHQFEGHLDHRKISRHFQPHFGVPYIGLAAESAYLLECLPFKNGADGAHGDQSALEKKCPVSLLTGKHYRISLWDVQVMG